MKSIWNDLSDRERYVVSAGGVIFIALVFFQFLILPLLAWHADLRLRAADAQQNYELVLRAASSVAAKSEPGRGNDMPLRLALTQTANAAGIDLVRVGAEADGQIEVQPARVDAQTLYDWLGVLRDQYGVNVAVADIAQEGDGAVRAQVLAFER